MEIVIKKDDKELVYKIIEPTFEVKSLAIMKLLKGGGEMDLIGAGSVIFDSCYSDIEGLALIKKDTDLYISICLVCAEIVNIYNGELKKN